MENDYHTTDGPSAPIPAGGALPFQQPVNATLSPSGEQVPDTQVAPQEFFSRSAGSSDVDSMQFKRLIRVFQRHWILIFFLGFLLGGLMFAYYGVLNKKYVPEWMRIGPPVQYASTVSIEQVIVFIDVQIQVPGLKQRPLQMDMSNLSTIFGRKGFRAVFIDEVEKISNNPKTTPAVSEALRKYIDNEGERSSMAVLLPGSIYNGQVRVTVQGNAKLILPSLADALVPALNQFGKEMRSKGMRTALNKLKATQDQNSKQLSSSYMRRSEVQLKIQRLLPPELTADPYASERKALEQSRAKLALELRRKESAVTRLENRIDYPALRRRFGIRNEDDIEKVVIKGNPLRTQWQTLTLRFDQLAITKTDQHPDVQAVQQDIIAVIRRIKETGGTTAGGKVPPLPNAEQEQNLQTLRQMRAEIQGMLIDLRFLEQRLAEMQAEREKPVSKLEVMDTPEMMKLNLELATTQAEVSRLEDIQRNLTKQIGDLEVAKNNLEKETEFNAISKASPSVYKEPRVQSNTLIGLILGLVVGYIIAYIAESSDTYLHTPSDVYYHLRLNYLGVVPRWSDREQMVIPAERPDSHIGEVYSHLCLNIRYGRSGTPEKRLLVASATQAEGKTTTAANIAIRYAVEGNKVLLVDADLRRPRLHKLLQISGAQTGHMLGVADYLAGGAGLEQICYPTNVSGLSIAPAGSRVRNPAKLLTSPALGQLLDDTDEAFDIVVVDCPAVLPVVDATIIAPHMLSVLLVVAADEVSIGAVRMAMYRLQHVGAPLIGALLNKVSERSTSYTYYGYRYRQGYYYSPYSKTYGDTEDDEDALE